MLDTLKTLCSLSGVSGYEDAVRDYILERCLPYADSVTTDPMGNLIVFKKGLKPAPRKLMICAHMDEVGLIVTGFNEDGYLRFSAVGGIDRRVLIGKRVYVGEKRVKGIIGIKPIHMVKGDEADSVPKLDDLYIDIGAENRESAEKNVKLGDYCAFDDTTVDFGNDYLKAKAIDDRVGCAAMLKLIESELPCDAWFVFTVQEELGTRGATVAAFSVAPELALVLEGTTATDLPGIDDCKRMCTAGEGIVIPFIDGGAVYDRGLYAVITGIADEMGMKWQTKRRIAGGTDAHAIQRSRAGVHTAAISCAVRNIHSPVSIVKKSECEDMLRLAGAFIEKFAAGEIVI